MVKPVMFYVLCSVRLAVFFGTLSLLILFFTRQATNPYADCWKLYLLCYLSTVWRVFSMHAGGHRYFSHKGYDAVPWLVQLFAITICLTDNIVLFYWVFLHNEHHAHCEEEDDIHSPYFQGYWSVQFGVQDNFERITNTVFTVCDIFDFFC